MASSLTGHGRCCVSDARGAGAGRGPRLRRLLSSPFVLFWAFPEAVLAFAAIRYGVSTGRILLVSVVDLAAVATGKVIAQAVFHNAGPTRMALRISARRLTDLAVVLAGRRRAALRDEWRAHLAGESGHDPVTWRKVRQALGFVASAIRCRCSDATEAAWTPVDAILKSRTLSNLFVLAPTWAAAYLVLRHEGTLGVVKAAESISAIGGFLYGLVRVGRWWRNVKPQEPKARRVKE